MRRYVILVLLALLGTAALVSAQEGQPTPVASQQEPVPPTATLHMVNGAWKPLALEPLASPDGPLVTTALPASDFCSDGPPLEINDGGITDVRNFTHPDSDPVLGCMWGDPPRAQGYRTAWYQFTPDFNGTVSLSTYGSNYDTVLAVYTSEIDGCNLLTQLACNDDSNYFSSRYDLQVQAGKTYYVEIADWQFGASGPVTLNISSLLQQTDSRWQVTSSGSDTKSFRSRHVVVAEGTRLYIIGGQTVIGDTPTRTPTGYVFNTANGNTNDLPPMPGGDGFGYSNTTAVNIDGRIYMPAGYIGNNTEYDGTHWVYDIDERRWDEYLAAPNDWAAGTPAIYSEATSYAFSGPLGVGYFLSGGLTGVFPDEGTISGWEARSELYFYSVSSNEWTPLSSMPSGRFGHVAAMQSIGQSATDHLCVAGGLGKDGTTTLRETLTDTACYNTDQGTWSPFAPLNYGRFFASSAVDPQGNWYVFGGYDGSGKAVPFTERYDRASDQWIALDARFNVGIANPNDPQAFTSPPRAWSRGAFVGNTLWIVGGETRNEQVLNMVQRADIFAPSNQVRLPAIVKMNGASIRNDTFASAQELSFGTSVHDRFYTADDYVNIYGTVVPKRQKVQIKLVHLSEGNELDLVVFTDNKRFVISSRQLGTTTEDLLITLSEGRYFVVVERIFPIPGINPTSAKYALRVGPG